MPEVVAQKGNNLKKAPVIELDLNRLDGNGDFGCPTCGIIISPEDESNDVYVILEEKVTDDILEEMLIQCNKCSCRISLKGISALVMDTTNFE